VLSASWETDPGGPGITSIILHNLPYQFDGLNAIATVIFVLNVVLFITFLLM
jgi:tellurite resistance protein TehA-like permease